jgi:beta-lactamase superfamily II metal-dependent hydrolase
MVVVTHHHADHYGGMEAVVREFRPRLFLATGSSHTSPRYLRLLQLVRDGGTRAIAPTDAPRRIGLGSVTMTVFPQPPESRRDENDNSIGIRVEYGTFSVLLTGDSEAEERAYWERVAPQLVRDCTVLKLAYHGSRNGTDARWLGLVRPQLAVASLGLGNEFGHPHPETLSLLARFRVPLLRTDRDGTVSVVSDGKTWGEAVPRRAPRGPPAGDGQVAQAKAGHTKAAGQPGRLVDINAASQAELESLPGVGPVIARRIVGGRPYGAVDDLLRVKGIGAKRMAELRPLVTAN